MNLPDMIFSRAQALPTALQQEALDFIGYLEQRYQLGAVAAARDDTEAFLTRLAGSLGADFPDEIDSGDLPPDLPRDTLP